MKTKTKKNHRGLHFLLLLILLLVLLSIAGAFYLKNRMRDVTFTPVSYTETNESIANPYCGWYHTYDYTLSEDTSFDAKSNETIMAADTNTRLALLRIDLSSYASGELSDHAISEVRTILASWTTSDKQLLLRFCYGRNDANSAPSDLETVYLHMEQLSSVINEYASGIYLLQGIFIGTDGEPIDSPLLTTDNLNALLEYYASLTDTSLFLSLHDSSQYLSATNQPSIPSSDNAYSGTPAFRVGLFDDHITTTISEAAAEATSALSAFVPHGGAIGADKSLMDADTAISLLSDQQISYLNADTNAAIIESWKNTSYYDDNTFAGVTVYDYMTTHLGYRYVVTNAALSFDGWNDEKASFAITVENHGFSNAYKRYDASIILRGHENEEEITIPLPADNRTWNPRQYNQIELSLPVRDYEKGTYSVYLMLLDSATGEQIALANDIAQSASGYLIGTLTIQ